MDRIKWLLTLLRDTLLAPLIMLIPRNRRKLVFGAWSGKQYSCNPKYLFEYMVKRGGFECIWIGEEHLRNKVLALKGAKFAHKGSFVAFWHIMTARFYVHNVQWRNEIINLPRCCRQFVIYTQHGYPDKLMGNFQYGGKGAAEQHQDNGSAIRKFARRMISAWQSFLYCQKSWTSVSSAQGEELRTTQLAWRLSKDRLIRAGLPRADFAVNNKSNEELKRQLKEKYAKILSLPASKKWYIFVPTWRHEKEYLFSFAQSKRIAEYERLLKEQDAILIEKQHPIALETMGMKGGKIGENIYAVSPEQAREIDMQELQLSSERLITDYSSVYYDTVLMDRPVIHFTYDYDHFMNLDMGFCFDFRQYGGGPFAYTEDELLKFMAQSDEELLAQRSFRTKAEQLTWETGHACEGYYELIEKLSRQEGYFVQ